MKSTRMQWVLVCVALTLPVQAWAQHGHPSAPSTPPPAGHEPQWQEQELDELIALGIDEEDWFADGADDGVWVAQDGSGGDQRRIVVRNARRGGGGRCPECMAMHAGMGHGRMGGGMGMHMRMAKLDLTEAQRDKMRDIHDAAMRKNIQRQADMKLARMDLRKLMRADAPSTQAMNAQADKIAKLQADGMKAHFETYMQARALLTPEQLKKLKETPAPGAGPGMMMHHGPGGPPQGGLH